MKIRTGFVTNSSSSSFIIAYRPLPEFDAETQEKYPSLSSFLGIIPIILDSITNCNTSIAEYCHTKQEFDKCIVNKYGWGCDTLGEVLECNELTDTYAKAMEYLESGYTIVIKEIGYDDSLEQIVHKLADKNDNFIILGGSEV